MADRPAENNPYRVHMGKVKPSWVQRLVQVALAVLALLVVTVIGLYVWLKDEILPPFDPATVRLLSPEKRREYDVLLFNQIAARSEPPAEPRYQLFLKMADDGFEVAYLTLQLFDIRFRHGASPPRNPEALARLKALAKEGDVSAQCLYGVYGGDFEPTTDSNDGLRSEYIKAAANRDHPGCLAAYGVNFASTQEEKALWLKKAAEKGNMIGQQILATAYGRGEGVPLDLGLAHCWVNEAIRQSGTMGAKSQVSIIHGYEYDVKKSGAPVVVRQYRPGTNCSELEN